MDLKRFAKSVEICDVTQGTELALEGDVPSHFQGIFRRLLFTHLSHQCHGKCKICCITLNNGHGFTLMKNAALYNKK